MSEVSEMWKEYKSEKEKMRDEWLEKTIPIIKNKLKENNIKYITKNDGVLYVIYHNNKVVDYWPTTKRWNCRSGKKTGWGIKDLLVYIKSSELVDKFKCMNTTLDGMDWA